MDWKKLAEVIREEWPPKNVLGSCSVCGADLYDALRDSHKETQASEMAATVHMAFKAHSDNTGHDSFDVDILKKPKMRRDDIDISVNVGEVDG